MLILNPTRISLNRTVTISAGTGGSVNKNSVTVKNGTTYTSSSNVITFSDGQTVTATASTGYNFGSWSSGSGTVTADMTITASFNIQTFTTSFTAGTGGTVSPSAYYNVPYNTAWSVSGNQVTVTGKGTATATANSGYNFSSWNRSGSGNITSDMSFNASFSVAGPVCRITGYSGSIRPWGESAVVSVCSDLYANSSHFNGATPSLEWYYIDCKLLFFRHSNDAIGICIRAQTDDESTTYEWVPSQNSWFKGNSNLNKRYDAFTTGLDDIHFRNGYLDSYSIEQPYTKEKINNLIENGTPVDWQ